MCRVGASAGGTIHSGPFSRKWHSFEPCFQSEETHIEVQCMFSAGEAGRAPRSRAVTQGRLAGSLLGI